MPCHYYKKVQMHEKDLCCYQSKYSLSRRKAAHQVLRIMWDLGCLWPDKVQLINTKQSAERSWQIEHSNCLCSVTARYSTKMTPALLLCLLVCRFFLDFCNFWRSTKFNWIVLKFNIVDIMTWFEDHMFTRATSYFNKQQIAKKRKY